MFKLILVKNDGTKSYDITPLVGAIEWDSNLSLMAVMEFTLNWNDTQFIPANPCGLGDVVILVKGEKEVYRGIIVTEGKNGRDAIKYTVYDYAWYLGKSKSVYQFNRVPASQAITKILNDFGMLIGNVPQMSTIIDEIYIEKSPAEIIDNIYKREEHQTGKRFNIEMRQGRIYFEEMKDLVIRGTFRLAQNVEPYDVQANPLGADRSRTIETMRNRIKILIEKDKNYEVVAHAQDEELINKYGLIEDVFKIDDEDVAKAREVARILLQRLARVQETNSLPLMGDVEFKAGRLLDVDEPITGMKGRFIIVKAKHTVKNQIHTMNLELTLPEEVR
jgi:hypothetical protein